MYLLVYKAAAASAANIKRGSKAAHSRMEYKKEEYPNEEAF